jgi:hypothetical protein
MRSELHHYISVELGLEKSTGIPRLVVVVVAAAVVVAVVVVEKGRGGSG